MRTWVALALGLLIATCSGLGRPSIALADPSHAAVPAAAATLVVVTDSPPARALVPGIEAALREPWRLGNDAAVRRALANAGQRTAPGVALGSAQGRRGLTQTGRRAATEAGVAAVLFIRAVPVRGGSSVTLLLVDANASDASVPVLDVTLDVPSSSQGPVAAALVAALARIVSVAPPIAPATPAVSVPPATPPAPPPARGEPVAPRLGRADRAIGVLSAGGGTGARFFTYHDGLTPELRNYQLPASPNLVLTGELYPLARLSVPVLRGLGVAGGITHAVGVSSKTSTGESVSTTWTRAEGDLRLRLGFAGDDAEGARVLLVVRGGVLMERFGFSGDASLLPWLPDVSYLLWRAGVNGRFRVGPVALLVGFSYLPAIAGGTLASRFRETSFAGIELEGGIAVPIVPIFELRASTAYTRLFYAFDPTPGDLYVAGGALDQLVRANLLATLLL